MAVPSSVNILCELAVGYEDIPRPVNWVERRRALFVSLAASPDGLDYATQWAVSRETPYCPEAEGALRQDRSRLRGEFGAGIETRRNRSRLTKISSDAIDARRFLAASARAEEASVEEKLPAWREVLSIWPRSRPLAEVHPYVREPSIFTAIEAEYRRALIEFGKAIDADLTTLSRDLRDFKKRATSLLDEEPTLKGEDAEVDSQWRRDAKALRHLLLRLRQREPMPDVDDQTAAYLEHYKSQCGFVCPQRLPHDRRSEDIVVPLSDVFVSLAFGPESSEEVLADHELAGAEADEGLVWKGGDPTTLDELVCERRWSVVLGDPGSGKTTLLQWLALQHANALLAGEERVMVPPATLGLPSESPVDLGPSRLPIFISLGEYAETAEYEVRNPQRPPVLTLGSLRDFLSRHRVLEQPIPLTPEETEQVVRSWFSADRVLVLLDGIDEVKDPDLVRVVSARISEFCRECISDPREPTAFQQRQVDDPTDGWNPPRISDPTTFGGSQLIATSREGGYGRAPLRGPFTIMKMEELDNSQVRRFVERWCHAVEKWQAQVTDGRTVRDEETVEQAKQKSRELLDTLNAHSSIKRMARNPLVLTILALLQRERGPVLPTRFKIFGELISVLVTRRAIEWNEDEAFDLLGPLALWMQKEGRRTAHRDDVARELRTALEERIVKRDVDRHVDEFLAAAKEQAGLLVETSRDYFGFFAHNVIREFLAAVELTRDPNAFVTWAIDHLDDPHWSEVLLLGIASIGEKHPTVIDDVLLAILDAPAGHQREGDGIPPYGVLYRHALLAGAALLEMQRGAPETVERIIAVLLHAGSERRHAVHRQLVGSLERSVAELLDTRSRQVAPALIDHLAKPGSAPFVCDALLHSEYSDIDLLVAVDAACSSPGHVRSAPVERTRLVGSLREQGVELDPVFTPLDELLKDVESSLARFSSLIEFLKSLGNWVDPPLYRYVRYLADHEEISQDAAVDRLLSLLREAQGDAFDSLARVGRAIDKDRVHRWILEQARQGTIEPHAAAIYLTTFPLEEEEVEPAKEVALILLNDLLSSAIEASKLGFAALDPGTPSFEPAWRALAAWATKAGSIPIVPESLKRVEELLAHPETRLHGELILAKLRLWKESPAEANDELRVLLEADDPVLAAGAALMLADDVREPLSVEQVTLIAETLSVPDHPLRSRGLRALSQTRFADEVSDAVLLKARELADERQRAGDAAAAFTLGGMGTQLIHADATRLHEWAKEDKISAIGSMTSSKVEEAIRGLADADEATRNPVLEACLRTANASGSIDVNIDLVADLCRRCELRLPLSSAAQLFTVLAINQERGSEIAPFLREVMEQDAHAAAAAIRIASWKLQVRPDPAVVAELHGIANEMVAPADAPWLAAAAQISLDAAHFNAPHHVLERLGGRTASVSEAARALLYSVSGVWSWGQGEGLEARIATVAEQFASQPHGMRALISVCEEPLDRFGSVGWEDRRGATHLLYAIASRHPALFLSHAPETLRARLIEACRDQSSFSVRREAFALMVRYAPIDEQVVILVKEATRDNMLISTPIAWHLRHRPNAAADRAELVDQIMDLLDEPNEQTVYSAATLLSELARRAPQDASGQDLRTRTRKALADRIKRDDPLLTIGSGRGLLNLRETLEVLLMESDDPSAARIANSSRVDPWKASKSPLSSDDSLLDAVAKAAPLAPSKLEMTIFSSEAEHLPLKGLSPRELELLNQAGYMLLEYRVGIALAERMRKELLQEFSFLISLGNDSDALRFLEAARPDYQEVVAQQRWRLRAEAKEDWDEIRSRLCELRPSDVEVATA